MSTVGFSRLPSHMEIREEILFIKYVRIACVVALYWCVSILTVFVNKTLLSDKNIDLDAPFFIVWYQCVVTAFICLVIKALSKKFPKVFDFPDGSPFSPATFRAVFPLSFLFTCMITFNTLCLKNAGVSFYYIGRSLTTVFNVALTFVVLKEKVSWGVVGWCCVIASGFILGIDQESIGGTLSISATLYGLLGSFCVAYYAVQTGKVLPYVNKNIFLLSYYNNVYSIITLLPIIWLSGEVTAVTDYKDLFSSHFWFLMTTCGVCGFAIGYATSLQIKVTSPLTHNISGTAKACAQTVIATYWYDESHTTMWWISNCIVLFGSAAYTNLKQKELKEKIERERSIV